MKFTIGVVVIDNFEGLHNFVGELGRELELLIDESIVVDFMFLPEDEEGVAFKELVVLC